MRCVPVLLLICPALLPAAAPPAAVPSEIPKLIDQLGDEDKGVRETAQKKLEALAERARPALREASKSHDDADVRLRTSLLLLALNKREIGEKSRFDEHTDEVTRVVALPDGKRAISLGEVPRLWDLSTRKTLLTYSQGRRYALSIDSKGERFAVTAEDSVLVYEVGANRLVRGFSGLRLAYGAALSPDGKTLFTSSDGEVLFLDVDSGKRVVRAKNGGEFCRHAAWSPDGKAVVAAHSPATESKAPDVLRLWDAKTGKQLWKADPLDRSIGCLAFSPDGKRIAIGDDKMVRILDAADGKEVALLKGHEGTVRGVTFSPDSKRVVSAGGRDRTVRVWDAATKKLVRCLEGHDDEVEDVTVTPDGKQVLSCGKDKTVRLWLMPR